MITQVENHVELGLARLIEQYKESANFKALLTIYIQRYQALEDAIWQVITLRYIDTAFGVQLDGLGAIVNEPRGGLDDTSYLVVIKAKILILKSSGTGNQIQKILNLCIPPGYTYLYRDLGSAALLVRINEQIEFNILGLVRLIPLLKAGGVLFLFIFSLDPPSERLLWGTRGFGSVYDPTEGGKMIACLT